MIDRVDSFARVLCNISTWYIAAGLIGCFGLFWLVDYGLWIMLSMISITDTKQLNVCSGSNCWWKGKTQVWFTAIRNSNTEHIGRVILIFKKRNTRICPNKIGSRLQTWSNAKSVRNQCGKPKSTSFQMVNRSVAVVITIQKWMHNLNVVARSRVSLGTGYWKTLSNNAQKHRKESNAKIHQSSIDNTVIDVDSDQLNRRRYARKSWMFRFVHCF